MSKLVVRTFLVGWLLGSAGCGSEQTQVLDAGAAESDADLADAVACSAEEVLCSELCTELSSDVQNCGACGNACDESESCGQLNAAVAPVSGPVDIIIVADNSASMGQEMTALEQHLSASFAQVLEATGSDYQIIAVANHGTNSYELCIGAPLSSTDECGGPPGETARFHQYDVDVQSHDGACILLDTFSGANAGGESDEWNLYPNGWSELLRPEASKVFLAISDDGMGDGGSSCSKFGGNVPGNTVGNIGNPSDGNFASINDRNDSTETANQSAAAAAATLFDSHLLALSPLHFGTLANRNYTFHSVIGIPAKLPPSDAYSGFEPLVTGDCSNASGGTSIDEGFGYQWLAKATGGLRFPVCQTPSYDVILQNIANHIVAETRLPCEFSLPELSASLDPSLLGLEYTPSEGGEVQALEQVAGASACQGSAISFFVEGETLELCPNTCDAVAADASPDLAIVAETVCVR